MWYFTPVQWGAGSGEAELFFIFKMSNFKVFIQPSQCVLPHFFFYFPNPHFQPKYSIISRPFHKFYFTLDTVSNIWTNNMKPNVSLHHIYMSINLVPICKYNMKYNVQYKHAKYLNKQFTTSSHSLKHITSK